LCDEQRQCEHPRALAYDSARQRRFEYFRTPRATREFFANAPATVRHRAEASLLMSSGATRKTPRTLRKRADTILLPNSVALARIGWDGYEPSDKFRKQFNTSWDRTERPKTPMTAVRCIRPLLEAPARTRSFGAALVRMRTLLDIGGRQDRGVRLWSGPKLTGIRQGKSRRLIGITKHNQWFAGVVQW
jgi:hypothetical protein